MSQYQAMIQHLRQSKTLMVEYLRLRLKNEDWHGVMDAAADIREIESQIKVLEEMNNGL